MTQTKEQGKQINNQDENIGKGEKIILPEPKLKSNFSLEEALNSRRSKRQFQTKDLKLEDISQILWAAQGITETNMGFRTAPSAGALYPLELFVIKSDGLFHYIPEGHKLEKLSLSDLRSELMKASLFQESISEAPVDIVITAIYERTTVKYGSRGIRYVHIEAGHACQNILLEATSLGLGAVPIGAFSDSDVQKVLNL
ncbi:MAG: SagB/ThcOx family dehydrogenase, partial [Actinobacteria bacterium]|nr:SagB/ThcOx family dehydrogenase [Actinomycetota bacterium]